MKSSLIISTYNWPEALNLVLLAIKEQTVLPNEVIIADDGSREETKKLVESFQKDFPVPIIHIWHEDDGFRLSEIRNKAILKSSFEYIIQIDGDIVVDRYFVEDHLRYAEKNCFITGSRVLLNSKVSHESISQKNISFSYRTEGLKNRLNAVRMPIYNRFSQPQNKPMEKLAFRIRGCNMSFWRQDLLDVNGYDEDFVGWGREDSDIAIRLLKKGNYRKKIKFAAIQYHLFHKENSKSMLETNDQILEKAMQTPNYKAKNGIVKL